MSGCQRGQKADAVSRKHPLGDLAPGPLIDLLTDLVGIAGQVQRTRQAELVRLRSLRVGDLHTLGAVHSDQDPAGEVLRGRAGNNWLKTDNKEQHAKHKQAGKEQAQSGSAANEPKLTT